MGERLRPRCPDCGAVVSIWKRERNEHLAEQQRALDAWDERMTKEARQMVHRAIGLPRD